ncbi:MAG: cyanophycin synthetase [Chloroflexota bacterium]|nr:cyanophycin synthetase [Chloroflexota bacterium]
MKRHLAGELLAQAGQRLGVTVELESDFGYVGRIVRPDGSSSYFRNTHFDLNGQGAADTAHDKAYCAYFLARLGYQVPEGQTFFAPLMQQAAGVARDRVAAYAYARQVGFPVIVKPNRGSQGRAVARVHTRRELDAALRTVFAFDPVALVQRPVPGADYRIVVLDTQVICAYRRVPLTVTGDGTATLRELLAAKHATQATAQRELTVQLDDPRIPVRLARQGLRLDHVPAAGVRVALLDNANLSAGGAATDVSAILHPSYADLAVRATHDLGLRYCGVDVLTPDPIDAPARAPVILELNAGPGLDHYAGLGPAQLAVVAAMYEAILRAILAL